VAGGICDTLKLPYGIIKLRKGATRIVTLYGTFTVVEFVSDDLCDRSSDI